MFTGIGNSKPNHHLIQELWLWQCQPIVCEILSHMKDQFIFTHLEFRLLQYRIIAAAIFIGACPGEKMAPFSDAKQFDQHAGRRASFRCVQYMCGQKSHGSPVVGFCVCYSVYRERIPLDTMAKSIAIP